MLGKLMPMLVVAVGIKLKVVRRSVGFLIRTLGNKGRRARNFALPVAGLEEPKAQLIIFTLRRTASTRAERHIARDWLAAWQLTQVASNRLLYELDSVQENLSFWRQRSNVDDHFWFLLLRQGPGAFFQQIRQLFVRKRRDVEALQLSEADMIEKRVLLLQLLSTMLCEALARVQRAGEILYMQEQESSPATSDDNYSPMADSVSSFGAGGGHKEEEEEELFDRVEMAVDRALREIDEAFSSLRTKAKEVLDVPNSKPAALSKEKSMLLQATTKVLRMKTRRQPDGGRQRVSRQPTLVKVEEEVEEEVDVQEEAATAAVMPFDEEEEALYRATDISGPVLYVSTQEAVRRGRRAIGVRPSILPPLPTNAPAHLAWEKSCSASRLLRRNRIFTLPGWLRAPSEAQQYWIRDTLVAVGAAYTAIFLYRHSRLSGSRDLEVWLCDMGESLESAVKDNMVNPLRKVTGGLFKTYKRRSNEREYNADRDSLQRMIADFKTDMERRSQEDSGSSGGKGSEGFLGLPFSLPWAGVSSGGSSSSSSSAGFRGRQVQGGGTAAGTAGIAGAAGAAAGAAGIAGAAGAAAAARPAAGAAVGGERWLPAGTAGAAGAAGAAAAPSPAAAEAPYAVSPSMASSIPPSAASAAPAQVQQGTAEWEGEGEQQAEHGGQRAQQADQGTQQAGAEPAPREVPAAGGSGADEGGEIEEIELTVSKTPAASRQTSASEMEGMELVMRAYEEAIKNPIKGLVTGQLPRTLLIQLQKMKTDGANTMLEMDQIIKSNELTVSLIAAVPAFLIAGSAAYATVKWLQPQPLDCRWEALPCRLAVLQMAQALERMCRREEENALEEMDEDRGWFYYCLALSHEEASSLFRRKRGLLLGRNAWREWPALRGDLIDLASPAPINARLRTTKRMMRAYSVFKY